MQIKKINIKKKIFYIQIIQKNQNLKLFKIKKRKTPQIQIQNQIHQMKKKIMIHQVKVKRKNKNHILLHHLIIQIKII